MERDPIFHLLNIPVRSSDNSFPAPPSRTSDGVQSEKDDPLFQLFSDENKDDPLSSFSSLKKRKNLNNLSPSCSDTATTHDGNTHVGCTPASWGQHSAQESVASLAETVGMLNNTEYDHYPRYSTDHYYPAQVPMQPMPAGLPEPRRFEHPVAAAPFVHPHYEKMGSPPGGHHDSNHGGSYHGRSESSTYHPSPYHGGRPELCVPHLPGWYHPQMMVPAYHPYHMMPPLPHSTTTMNSYNDLYNYYSSYYQSLASHLPYHY